MESSDVITSYLHEEDILSSLLDTAKEASSDYPINYNYLDFGLVDLSPSPGACLPDVKLDKELGEFEDEGFEDCFEEEEGVLQRDVDPSLANIRTIPLNVINTSGLDVFFPLDITDEEDVFMANELDQGVAMESSEHHLHGSLFSDVDCSHDFTLLCNPLPLSSSFTPSYTIPQPPIVSSSPVPSFCNSPITNDYTLPSSPAPTTPGSVIEVARQDKDLDYLYTLLQSDPPVAVSNCPVVSKTSPHRTNVQETHRLADKLMSSSLDSFNINGDINKIPLSFLNTQVNPINTTHIDHITLANNDNSHSAGSWSSSNVRNRGSDRQHSPSPSPTFPLVTSPASSVYTDYPDSEYGKELGSPDVPSSIMGFNKMDIVEMPFYEFKKIVDSGSISERDKEEVKAIRKRGKNKMAAKTCRQRKLEVLNELQREVDRLKGSKARLALKALSLQREIESYKSRCNSRHINTPHRLLPSVVH